MFRMLELICNGKKLFSSLRLQIQDYRFVNILETWTKIRNFNTLHVSCITVHKKYLLRSILEHVLTITYSFYLTTKILCPYLKKFSITVFKNTDKVDCINQTLQVVKAVACTKSLAKDAESLNLVRQVKTYN